MPDLYYFRDGKGNEVDLLIQAGREVMLVEIKAASTFSPKMLKGIHRYKNLSKAVKDSWLVYNGDPLQMSEEVQAIPYSSTDLIFKA